MISKEEYIMNDIQSKLDWLNLNTSHNIAYIAHQGSANYDMYVYDDNYHSDIDVKAISIPSLEDIIKGKKMLSHVYVMDDDSHIEVKDIRLYIDLWKKSNPTYLEILFSDYKIVCNEEFNNILELADNIAFSNIEKLFSTMKGMQNEKYKHLEHASPSSLKYIEKYGYNPKELHHIYRLYLMGKYICEGKSFREALLPTGDDKDMCLNYKISPVGLENARYLSELYFKELKVITDQFKEENDLTVNNDVYTQVEDIIYNIVLHSCEKQIMNK